MRLLLDGLDRIADWLRHAFGPRNQVRLGVIAVLGSIPLMLYGFFTSEPFFVYEMSAIALFYGGLGMLFTAETLEEVAETSNKGNP